MTDSGHTDTNRDPHRDAKKAAEEKVGPDKLSPAERQTDDYIRLDSTREVPVGPVGDGIGSHIVNPAFYPKGLKPEVLHTEAERAGSEWPGTAADKKAYDEAGAPVPGPSRSLPAVNPDAAKRG